MAPAQPRLRVLSVGGNAISAFLSWRLQATNACDVTLVWKSNFQHVEQYGITFKSIRFGNERFKPRFVVQSPEDAAGRETAFDYVLLCVKALPDMYNLADIIQSVVIPQHTCILVNTTNTLGVEKQLEERFPTNVVLSLVSGADLAQLGTSEFEHSGSTEIWVGPATTDSKIPQSIQRDMSEALAMTLNTGQVDCKVSDNIRQQQYDRMIGPIAFHPLSVLFETSDLAELIRKPGVRELVEEIMEELMTLATAHKCVFSAEYKSETISAMTQKNQDSSTMYQDFEARRPMEIETYLGSPCSLAAAAQVPVPRIKTMYTILRHINSANKDKPPVAAQSVASMAPPMAAPMVGPPPGPRANGNPPPMRPMTGPGNPNGNGRVMPMRQGPNGMLPPGRRGPPPVNGFRGQPGFPPRGQSQIAKKPSFDDANLDEFSHVVLYDDIPDGDVATIYGDNAVNGSSVNLRERELMLREKELRLREHEIAMRSRGGRRGSHNRHQNFADDDEDDEDYFDPMDGGHGGHIDPDNFDMMSVTSRRGKRTPSQGQLRRNMYEGGGGGGGMRPGSYNRHNMGRHRTSTQLMADMPVLGSNILDNPMMGFSSNRYGNVDRKEMAVESRTNSLTASRLQEMAPGNGPFPGGPYPPPSRRTSRSPGNPLHPMGRPPGRPSPPNDSYAQGPPRNGRPSPPGLMQAPGQRFPPGANGMMPPHRIEQEAGVSKPFPTKPTKSLTGSASASAGSGDSANVESEPSAHSSTSSFAPRTMMAVQ